jgi:hypothetical protein
MENGDLTILQRLVQESIQKVDLAGLQVQMLAKAMPPRMDALEGRMGALEQRMTLIENGQHEVIRMVADVQSSSRRIEAMLGDIAGRLP